MADTIERNQTFTISKMTIGKIEEPSTKYDIRGIFDTLQIFSNIDSFITSGFVIIMEADNLISRMPIECREYIEIEFCTLDDKNNEYDTYHRTFFIYAIDNISESKDGRTYCLRFTDAIGLLNNDIRLSIKYEDKCEDIISKIQDVFNHTDSKYYSYYEKILTETNIQKKAFVLNTGDRSFGKTTYDMKFVVPKWKPIQTIQYLTSRAVSDNFSDLFYAFCDCTVFQNRKGEIIFTDYKRMFNSSPLQNKSGNNITLQKRIGNVKYNPKSVIETKRHIIDYKFSTLINFQAQKSSGQFGFTDHITNFLTKVSEPTAIPFLSNFGTEAAISEILGLYGINNGVNDSQVYAPLTTTENSLYTYNVSSIDSNASEDEYRKFVQPYQRSISIRQLIENNKLSLICQGMSDMDIGKSIIIDLGDNTDNKVTPIAKYINNLKWVVSAITHKITQNEYTTSIECYTPFLRINGVRLGSFTI